MKDTKIIINVVSIARFPSLSRRCKVDWDSMIDLRGWIGVEEYLTWVPVTLGDVRNIENTRCVTATLDLEKRVVSISWGSSSQ